MDKKLVCFCILVLSVSSGCSSQKDTFINRLYHNTTARFNAYYLVNEKVKELEAAIEDQHQEDFSQILPVFYPIDSATIDGQEALIKEARELASKAIEWHRISKWVDPSYFLLGKLDYYEGQFDEAMNTFRYLNVNSKQNEVRHLALVQLLRTFIDLRRYDDAAFVIDFLSKEPGISRANLQYLYKTLAHYYEVRGETDMIGTALNKALENTDDKRERSRLNFIMGQLYQRAGLDAFAYDYYQRSLSGSPPYERTFFAQLYSQQVAELERSRDFRRVRNYYEELYKDRKNIDLRDVILYEKALFELKQDELEEGIRLLNLAADEPGKNPRQKGYIYQKLAEIYFDMKDYQATKRYLDLALENFRETDSQYDQTALRKTVIDEYVSNYEVVEKNDSLLMLSGLSVEEQEAYAEQFIKAEEERLLREAEEASAPKSTSIFNNLLAFGGGGGGGTFYWSNSLAMQQGAIEFSRIWGNRSLEDNWRRSNKGFQESMEPFPVEEGETPEEEPVEEPTNAIMLPDKETLLQNIPRDEESQQRMNEELEEAYFNLGKISLFDLQEPELSIEYLEKLIQEYPKTARKPESYYTLSLAAKEVSGDAVYYENLLKTEFPLSPFTKSLDNPEGNVGNQANLVSAKNYRIAYDLHAEGEYLAARTVIRETMDNYPLNSNRDKLLLLDIMIAAKVDGSDTYSERLENYIEEAEDSDLVELARNMLYALSGTSQKAMLDESVDIAQSDSIAHLNELVNLAESRGIEVPTPYNLNLQLTHIFVLAMPSDQSIENKNLTADLEHFNRQHYSNERLRTGIISLTDEQTIVIISPFNNAEKAMAFRAEFLKSFNADSLPEELKMSSFVISIENFQEFNKRKDVEEYMGFFQDSYL